MMMASERKAQALMRVRSPVKRERWCECEVQSPREESDRECERKSRRSKAIKNMNAKHVAWGSEATENASTNPERVKRPSWPAGMSAANVGLVYQIEDMV